ncbi:hypothetical protein KGF56_002087 [Candida oxycetoniae]|uniref:UDENN FLCN/SMCR8-type domain-containing protein n=1 Tax=Candida oxycetoniae TaxID=497107 RepID=A0AAI9SYJ6_9ASCO|nr:uncharacterized protein KGF56_002087 [Candida oxycetoniae]KAI3405131.1 hypothetical protein KGF56_002087 [Candida oxycetoniae]
MPNYIVCLSHFCELHGPSVIACTQFTKSEQKQDNLLSSNSRVINCSSCQLVLPQDALNLSSLSDSKSFVTTHYPSSQKRYAALTKFVMKSLSVETNLDLSKPMFFGDAIDGFCMNKIFKIYDINARGQERKYSLMVMSDSESHLLENWDIISLYFVEVINSIQEKVHNINEKIHQQNGLMNGNLVDNEKYLRRSMARPKSLVELTGDDQIFVKLHLWAIELLKDITR